MSAARKEDTTGLRGLDVHLGGLTLYALEGPKREKLAWFIDEREARTAFAGRAGTTHLVAHTFEWADSDVVRSRCETIDASNWTPARVMQWRRENPGADADKHLFLGDPHTPSGGARWDAAFGPLPDVSPVSAVSEAEAAFMDERRATHLMVHEFGRHVNEVTLCGELGLVGVANRTDLVFTVGTVGPRASAEWHRVCIEEGAPSGKVPPPWRERAGGSVFVRGWLRYSKTVRTVEVVPTRVMLIRATHEEVSP